MSLAKDELFFNSLYGPLGITSKISKKDLEAIKALQTPVAAPAALAASGPAK